MEIAVAQRNLEDASHSVIVKPIDGESKRSLGHSIWYECPVCYDVLRSCPEFLEHIANHLEVAKASEFFYLPDGRVLLADELDSGTGGQIFIPRIMLTPYEQLCNRAQIVHSETDRSLPTILDSRQDLLTRKLRHKSDTYFDAIQSAAVDTTDQCLSSTAKQNRSQTETTNDCTKKPEGSCEATENNKEIEIDLSVEIAQPDPANRAKPKRRGSKFRAPSSKHGEVMLQDTLMDNLSQHKLLKAKNGTRKVGKGQHSCHVCNKTLTTAHNLRFHIKNHEVLEVRNRNKKFRCKICAVKFTHKEGLAKHVKKHAKNNPFQCRVCGYNFSERGHLNRHLALHFDELKLSCDICGVKIARHDVLKRHKEKMHKGKGTPVS